MSYLLFTDMHVVYCGDLDNFVKNALGFPYNTLHARALSYDYASQNTYESFDTNERSWQDEDAPTVQQWLDFDRSVVDGMEFQYEFERNKWLEDNMPTPSPETMVRYFADNGHFPHGSYLIQYWW